MHSPSGRYVLVFNGEIYNFIHLRKELARLSYVFAGGSDTEVLCAAIEQWGVTEAAARADGMFSFCVYDRRERRLAFARDRLGEKPLFYGWLGRRFVFASELTALVAGDYLGELRESLESLDAYLHLGYVTAPYTVFDSVYKLSPGEVLTATLEQLRHPKEFSPFAGEGALSPQKYWSLPSVVRAGQSAPIADAREAVDQLDSLLNTAVKQQMIADVPLGGLLSGGIDSTTVIAIMQRNSGRAIRSFTVGYDDPQFNESTYAKAIATRLGTEHVEAIISPEDCVRAIPRALDCIDEPMADSSIVPTYVVCEQARQHVKVCLSGDGGDELFAGYNRYRFAASSTRRAKLLPGPLRRWLSSVLRGMPMSAWDTLYSAGAFFVPPGRRYRNVGVKLQKLGRMMAHDDEAAQYRSLVACWETTADIINRPRGRLRTPLDLERELGTTFIDQAMFWDQLSYLPGDNLTKVDRASMAVGLETRLPILSKDVVEFAWRVPLSLKLRNGTTKWLLREVLRRYLPLELVDRPKMGFSLPIASWLRLELREWADQTLREIEGDVLDAKGVRGVWDAHLRARTDYSFQVWSLLVYQHWRQRVKRIRNGVVREPTAEV